MKNTFNVVKLREILKLLVAGLPGRSIIFSVQDFFFLEKEIGTFNDEVCLKIPYEELPWNGSVPAKEFLGILNSCSAEHAEAVLDSGKVRITAPGLKAEIMINLDNPVMSVIAELEAPKKWKKLPEEAFKNGLKICGISVSSDITQGFLTCVAIEKDKMFSSDDFRITSVTLPEEISQIQVLLPWRAINDLIAYNPTDMSVRGGWCFFKTKTGVLFASRILKEDFTNPEKFFDLENVITVPLPENLIDVIQAIEVFSKKEMDDLKRVEIKIQKNEMIIRASSSKGFIERSLDLKYKGEIFSFVMNPDFLIDIVSYCSSFDLSLENHKALFVSDNFKHIVLLLQD